MTSRNVPLEVPMLGLKCDETEMPYPLSGNSDSLFVGRCDALVSAPLLRNDGTLGDVLTVEAENLAFAAGVQGRTLLLILAPDEPDRPAVWLRCDGADIAVEAIGSVGTFKKRPAAVSLAAANTQVLFRDVAQLFGVRRTYQTGRSGPLLAALQALGACAAQTAPGTPAPPAPTPVAAPVPAAWKADPSGRHQLRWWDGNAWSTTVADNGVTSSDG